mmetsp:Transcript_3304/g.7451  ORF Transcript_3304/g.7451 Transcript_3304/m.7451 type:complete len:84 (+) Transcript_3304:409-660(+)
MPAPTVLITVVSTRFTVRWMVALRRVWRLSAAQWTAPVVEAVVIIVPHLCTDALREVRGTARMRCCFWTGREPRTKTCFWHRR